MKTALITTTIGSAGVLRLYRSLDPSVRFFIAGDFKSNNSVLDLLVDDIGNAEYLGVTDQKKINYACSEVIGWNSIQRRNIATLEALKWGADYIISVDDDNIPLGPYFSEFDFANHNGLQAESSSGWFDVGGPHRGFPHTKRGGVSIHPVVGAKIGVMAGVCLGDPDIDAVTRIAIGPALAHAPLQLHSGVVFDPSSGWTVYNSQNTCFIRELAPAMFMIPGIGRMDDIYASLITQRVMRDRDYVVHFGKPFVHQQRNKHDLIKDLKAEIFGMEHIVEFAEWLDGLDLSNLPVLPAVKAIYTCMPELKWMPAQAYEAGIAWTEDCEKVL